MRSIACPKAVKSVRGWDWTRERSNFGAAWKYNIYSPCLMEFA